MPRRQHGARNSPSAYDALAAMELQPASTEALTLVQTPIEPKLFFANERTYLHCARAHPALLLGLPERALTRAPTPRVRRDARMRDAGVDCDRADGCEQR